MSRSGPVERHGIAGLAVLGWWEEYTDIMSKPLQTLVELEAEASWVRTYDGQVIPGLPQTKEYAERIITAGTAHVRVGDIDRLLELSAPPSLIAWGNHGRPAAGAYDRRSFVWTRSVAESAVCHSRRPDGRRTRQPSQPTVSILLRPSATASSSAGSRSVSCDANIMTSNVPRVANLTRVNATRTSMPFSRAGRRGQFCG
jgi:hypothetical protein